MIVLAFTVYSYPVAKKLMAAEEKQAQLNIRDPSTKIPTLLQRPTGLRYFRRIIYLKPRRATPSSRGHEVSRAGVGVLAFHHTKCSTTCIAYYTHHVHKYYPLRMSKSLSSVLVLQVREGVSGVCGSQEVSSCSHILLTPVK